MVGSALLYATGGLAIGQQSFEVHEKAPATNIENFDETMVGWTAGGGVEYAFSSNWTARIEYRYTDFGDVTITPSIYDYDGEYDVKTVRRLIHALEHLYRLHRRNLTGKPVLIFGPRCKVVFV